tara:strand:- start:973 stop:2613 length:1641 start_codon:yes stop_codon:yes gene_type:complete
MYSFKFDEETITQINNNNPNFIKNYHSLPTIFQKDILEKYYFSNCKNKINIDKLYFNTYKNITNIQNFTIILLNSEKYDLFKEIYTKYLLNNTILDRSKENNWFSSHYEIISILFFTNNSELIYWILQKLCDYSISIKEKKKKRKKNSPISYKLKYKMTLLSKLINHIYSYSITNNHFDIVNLTLQNKLVNINFKNISKITEKPLLFRKIYTENKKIIQYIKKNIHKFTQLFIQNGLEEIIPNDFKLTTLYITASLSKEVITDNVSELFLQKYPLPWLETLNYIDNTNRDKFIDLIVEISEKYGTHHLQSFINKPIILRKKFTKKNWEYFLKKTKHIDLCVFNLQKQLLIRITYNNCFRNVLLPFIKKMHFSILNEMVCHIISHIYEGGFYYVFSNTKNIIQYLINKNLIIDNISSKKYIHNLISNLYKLYSIISKKKGPDVDSYMKLLYYIWKSLIKSDYVFSSIIHMYMAPIDRKIDNEQCNICSDFMNNDNAYQLPCGHRFHQECVKSSFKASIHNDNNTSNEHNEDRVYVECPYCRDEIVIF